MWRESVLEDEIADVVNIPSVNQAIDAVCSIEDTFIGRWYECESSPRCTRWEGMGGRATTRPAHCLVC